MSSVGAWKIGLGRGALGADAPACGWAPSIGRNELVTRWPAIAVMLAPFRRQDKSQGTGVTRRPHGPPG
jgi:hypothetical protein